MKPFFVLHVLLAVLLSACGGGGGSGNAPAQPSAPATPTPVVTAPLTGLPNSHGLYPDAKGNFQTDLEAGIFANDNGFGRSYSTAGKIDPSGPFFLTFGNGRTCNSCHKQENGFSITSKGMQDLFAQTNGNDPIFQLVDGANSPRVNFNSLDEKRAAYSMLLSRGVIRIGLPIPASAEFELASLEDPYKFASARELSLFRRPLPTANLKFLADVMWDGRETATDASASTCVQNTCFAALDTNLGHQANTATIGHAQAGADLKKSDQDAIVAFQKTLFAAQQVDTAAGLLFAADGTGGAVALSNASFAFGVNDIFTAVATGDTHLFNQNIFALFSSWIADASSTNPTAQAARQSIARGQSIFNNRQFTVSKTVPGTEALNFTFFTCGTCHSVPNVGNLAEPRYFNIGTADAQVRTPDMPLYTLRNKKTGDVVQTQDPGRAMTSGLWKDVGSFKTPTLRGLSMRAPYFHDGSARTIEEAVAFYDKKFSIQLTQQELMDLSAFLKAL